jgi:dTDP-4-dehydrorhamnose 3,5-epimerase
LKVTQTSIPDLLIIEPKVFGDDRGFFFESFNRRKFAELTGKDVDFVQDNHSRSVQGVLRGLHYQIQHPQGKLVRAVQGTVLDVAVDIRKSSKTFGQHVAIELSAENKRMFWIPEGFAHGFIVLSDTAEFLYKTTDYWFPEHERCILWNDPALKIDWKLQTTPSLSAKDAQGKYLAEADLFTFSGSAGQLNRDT